MDVCVKSLRRKRDAQVRFIIAFLVHNMMINFKPRFTAATPINMTESRKAKKYVMVSK